MKQTKYYGFRLYAPGCPVKEEVTHLLVERHSPPLDVIIAEAINTMRLYDVKPIWGEIYEVCVNESSKPIGFLPAKFGGNKPHAFIIEESEGDAEESNGIYFIKGQKTGATVNDYEVTVVEFAQIPG